MEPDRGGQAPMDVSAIHPVSNAAPDNTSTFYADTASMNELVGDRDVRNDTSLSFHQISLSTVGGGAEEHSVITANTRRTRSTGNGRKDLAPPAPSPQRPAHPREPTSIQSFPPNAEASDPYDATMLMERLTKQRRGPSPNRSANRSEMYPDRHPKHNSNSPTAKLLTDRRVLNESNVYDTSVAYSTAGEDDPIHEKVFLVGAAQFRPPPALPPPAREPEPKAAITSSIYAMAAASSSQDAAGHGYASNEPYRKALLSKIVQQRQKQRENGQLRERVYPSSTVPPTSNSHPKTRNKAGGKDVIERMKEKEAQAKHEHLILKHERELKEVAECTFAPSINKAPPNPNITQPMIDAEDGSNEAHRHYTKETAASEAAKAAAAAQRMLLAERAHQRQQEMMERIAKNRGAEMGGNDFTDNVSTINDARRMAPRGLPPRIPSPPSGFQREEFSRTRSPHRFDDFQVADGNIGDITPPRSQSNNGIKGAPRPCSPSPAKPQQRTGQEGTQLLVAAAAAYQSPVAASRMARVNSFARSGSKGSLKAPSKDDSGNIVIDFDRMSGRYSAATNNPNPMARWGRRNSLTRSESSTLVDVANCTFKPFVAPTSKNVYKNGTRRVEGSLDTFTRLYSRSLSFQSSHPDHAARLAQEEAERNEYRRTASAAGHVGNWGSRGTTPIIIASPSSEGPLSASPIRGGSPSRTSFQDPTNLLLNGAPEHQWAANYVLNRLPTSLTTELETLRSEVITKATTDEDMLTPSAHAPVPLVECQKALDTLPPTHPTLNEMSRNNSASLAEQHATLVPPHFMVPFLCNVLGVESVRGIEPVPSAAHIGMSLTDNKDTKGYDCCFDLYGLCDGDHYYRNKMKAEIVPTVPPKPRRLFARYTSNTTSNGSYEQNSNNNKWDNTTVDMTAFIRRQEAMQKSRERRHLELCAKLAPSHKPQLSATTVALFARKSKTRSQSAVDAEQKDADEEPNKENQAPEEDRKRTNSNVRSVQFNAQKASAGEEKYLQQFGRSHSAPKAGKIEATTISYFNKRSPSELAKPKTLPTKHYDENLTFRPMISEFAHSQASGYGHDRLHADAKTRQKRIETLRAEAIKKERETVATFKPKTNKDVNADRFGNVESLLNHRNLHSDAYKTHLARARKIQEAKLAVKEVAADEEDLKECTFRPVINKTPSYITQMSNGYAHMRAL